MITSTAARLANRKRQWKVLWALGIGTILALAGDLTLYAVLPAYAKTRAFDLVTVGLMLSANRLVRLGSNPLVGLLLAGARRREFVLTGFGLGTISTLLYVAAPGPGLFLAGRLLWGISWSLIYIGSYCMLLDITDEQDRGWGSGILQGFTFIGLAAMPLIGGLLSDQLGFNSALSICAVLSAAGFLIALVILPETRRAADDPHQAAESFAARWKNKFRFQPGSFRLALARSRQLFHFKNLAANFIYLATNFISDGILLSTLSLHLKNQYGAALQISGFSIPIATAGGVLLALRATVSALVAPMAGSLSDRARSRWSGVAWGVLACSAGMLLIAGLSSPLGLLTGVVLAASGSALVITIIPPLAREINPGSESGTIVGLLANSADLGMALAPLAAYTLAESLALPTIYLISGLALSVGLPLVWAAARPRLENHS